jgi:hypothetical protein
LRQAERKVPASKRASHGLRKLHEDAYLSLFLLGLFNPIVTSMRGLCAASSLPKVQEQACRRRVGLSRFSEAQGIFDPELLRQVLSQQLTEVLPQVTQSSGGRFDARALRVVDSTIWKVLPRMQWAHWRNHRRNPCAVRLHVKLSLDCGLPVEGALSPAKTSERALLRQQVQAGEIYIMDRYYGEEYGLLEELVAKGCGFLTRLRKDSNLEWKKEEVLTEQDRNAGIIRTGIAYLGRKRKGPFRIVWIQRPDAEAVILVASDCFAEMTAAEVAELYRLRWQVELFFRWLKCLLPCRHWFAESQQGVTLQIYLALICGLLLAEVTGRRPSKRMMELLRWHLAGWASAADLQAGLDAEFKAASKKN